MNALLRHRQFEAASFTLPAEALAKGALSGRAVRIATRQGEAPTVTFPPEILAKLQRQIAR